MKAICSFMLLGRWDNWYSNSFAILDHLNLFRVNCSFYFKIGACRHGERCSRLHNKPTFSQVSTCRCNALKHKKSALCCMCVCRFSCQHLVMLHTLLKKSATQTDHVAWNFCWTLFGEFGELSGDSGKLNLGKFLFDEKNPQKVTSLL